MTQNQSDRLIAALNFFSELEERKVTTATAARVESTPFGIALQARLAESRANAQGMVTQTETDHKAFMANLEFAFAEGARIRVQVVEQFRRQEELIARLASFDLKAVIGGGGG